jgi:hypothetical protein
MYKFKISFLALMFLAISAQAQENFSFKPQKPKPGDVIEVTYTPAGDLANTLGKVQGSFFLSGKNGRKAEDLLLTKTGKKFTGSIQTDTSTNFVQLAFFVDHKYDNNDGNGYHITLYEKGKVRKGAFENLAYFFQVYGQQSGVEKDNIKALGALEQEFSLYPEQKKALAGSYFRLLNSEKKEEAQALIQKETESALAAGIKTEADYNYLATLYSAAGLTDKAKATTEEKKAKFPQGKWVIGDYIDRFSKETDVARKTEMLAVIRKNIETNKDWKAHENGLSYFQTSTIRLYANTKQWDAFKKMSSEIKDKTALASLYNGVAWSLQEKNEDIKLAEELSKTATEIARSEWKNPSGERPAYVTASGWEKQRAFSYAMFADTYAMVLYKAGDFQKRI